jgi:hypothetical protein
MVKRIDLEILTDLYGISIPEYENVFRISSTYVYVCVRVRACMYVRVCKHA